MAVIDAKPPSVIEVTIANSASSQVVIVERGRMLSGLFVPSGTEGDVVLIDVSPDGGTTWYELWDNAGNLIKFDYGGPALVGEDATLAGIAQPTDQALALPWTHIRVKTATDGSPPTLQAQSGAAVLQLVFA